MLDWEATKKQFGYSSLPNKSRPKVVCVCDKCKTTKSIEIKVKSRIQNEQMPWLCSDCLRASPEYKEKMAALSKTMWKKNRAKMVEIFASQDYKKKVAVAARTKWEDPEYREKIAITKASTEYKEKIIIAKSSSDYIEKMATAAKVIWEDPEYREKIAITKASTEYKEKMAATIIAVRSDPEYIAKIAKAHASPEYIAKMAAVYASPEYRKKMAISIKTKWKDRAFREKVIVAINTTTAKEKSAIVRATQSGRISSIQMALYSYLDEMGVEYHKEGERTRIGYYVFDCLVVNGNKKILIECQGDYWHSLEKNERNDRSKFTYISRYFPEYEIMYVWEHEFYCKDRVLDRLKLKLGINIETKEFKFSDLTLKSISFNETKQFLDLYHYLGKDRGGKAFGAYFNDMLIATIVFSPPLRQNTAGQFGLADGEVRELSRLCIHPSYHKKNFASWFVKQAIKQIDCKLIVAYADTTVGHNGGIYKASNFMLHHVVPADYWYVDASGYVMHKRTLYGRAKSLKMTEAEFAKTKGYARKYGGEKLCYVFPHQITVERTNRFSHITDIR